MHISSLLTKVLLALAVGVVLLSTLFLSVGYTYIDVVRYTLVNGHPPHYDYEGYSGNLPSHLKPGDTLNIAWRSYAHTQEDAKGDPAPVSLRILLVEESRWKQEICGAYQMPILLDRIDTDDQSGFPYLAAPSKKVHIPPTITPGQYQFVQEMKTGTQASCASNPLVVTQ